ncbi:hypothetical protein BOTCAL_0425g00010 [Botryotinia calthae]|uniref:Uncharacterized protein n=1 Tax=Botryotinia calthae TaxID=38488 RepID=A0A4Y8CRP5_9HELO|nr:hypothetical protein BOTCAL_0425g00010 [Botryotinia calthae]
MSSHPFPHAITLSQFSSQEFDGFQQLRLDSPPPPPSPPNTNYALVDPIQHYYSSLLSSPQLGSSPQSVVYAPLPSQLQVQSQETPTQPQQSPPSSTTSPYPRRKQQALRNATSRTQLHSQPESHHHLLSPSIPSAFQIEHQQISNATHAPEINYNTISSSQYAVSTQFPDFSTRLFPFFFPGLPMPYSSSPHTSTSTSTSVSTPSSSSASHSSPQSHSDSDLETGIEDNRINELAWDAQHTQELAVQRAQHMCAWFTGVMIGMLGVVGVVRWVVYG